MVKRGYLPTLAKLRKETGLPFPSFRDKQIKKARQWMFRYRVQIGEYTGPHNFRIKVDAERKEECTIHVCEGGHQYSCDKRCYMQAQP